MIRKKGRIETVEKRDEEEEGETGGEKLKGEGVWKERKSKGGGQGRKKEEKEGSGRGEGKGERRVKIE